MIGNNSAQRKRSYDRNLGWCRVWLGIGIAIASLSFTFVFERNIQPLLEPRPAVGERTNGEPPVTDVRNNGTAVPDDRNSFAYGLLSAVLILSAGACLVISRHFRRLYLADDLQLAEIERNINTEDKP